MRRRNVFRRGRALRYPSFFVMCSQHEATANFDEDATGTKQAVMNF